MPERLIPSVLRALLAALIIVLAPATAAAGKCPVTPVWNPSKATPVAACIAGGHAWGKHGGEYRGTGVDSQPKFQALVERVLRTAGVAISNGRYKWWDAGTKTIVIFNPRDNDCGTAFRPTAGKRYYDNQY